MNLEYERDLNIKTMQLIDIDGGNTKNDVATLKDSLVIQWKVSMWGYHMVLQFHKWVEIFIEMHLA